MDYYNLEEIRELCFDLKIVYENLAAPDTREAKSRELILLTGKENKFNALIESIKQSRPSSFQKLNLSLEPEFLDSLYEELEPFENYTKPRQERLLENLSTSQVVGFSSIVILLLLTGFAIVYFLRPQSPSKMTGHFRIAVAEFEEIGETDGSQIGRELAQDAFLQLQKTFGSLDLGFIVTTWGPELVGKISGDTSEERASSAALLADQIDAHMIIYGMVGSHESGWFAVPEFYISEATFYQAEEITGQHELGASLPIAGQGNIAGRIRASEEMAWRTRILSQIIVGLSYYAIEDFGKAAETYLLIEEIDDWHEKGDYPIVSLLLGNAYAKNEQLDLAKHYYQQSISFDPEYARGYLGVANMYYRKALKSFEESGNPTDTDPKLLLLALQTLEKAESAENQSSSADISTKAHFERGQIYFMQVYSGQIDSFEKAISEFNDVIEEYDSGTNPRIRELAAESHARLALIYDLNGLSDQSAKEYMEASSLLTSDSERQAYYEQRAKEVGNTQ